MGWGDGRAILLLSVALALEYEAVVVRAEHLLAAKAAAIRFLTRADGEPPPAGDEV